MYAAYNNNYSEKADWIIFLSQLSSARSSTDCDTALITALQELTPARAVAITPGENISVSF